MKKVNWKLLKKLYQKFNLLNKKYEKNFNHNDQYIALIGQWKLKELPKAKTEKILDEINQKYKEIIAAKFVSTVPGEINDHELQGLINKKCNVFEIIFELFTKIKSLTIGLGSGDLNTDKKKMALGMDVPVFYNARAALNEAKKEKWMLKYKEDNKFLSEYISI